MARLRAVGLSEAGLEQAITVAAFFNYFPRMADGVGIDFDYESPLPRISIDHEREAIPRPPESAWNPRVDGSTLPVFPTRAHASAPIEAWRAYLFNRDAPLTRHERLLIARTVAEELCDPGAVAAWREVSATNPREQAIRVYAAKLTRAPWAISAPDLTPLRASDLDDPAILDVIAITAHQNAISRMHHGLAAMTT